MQRMGGGKYRGKHSGGGNDPSCGCDMQAGWPSASELPRGGLQGGGNWNFNEFNLALTKNGKTRHLKGKWNKNNNGMRPSMNTSNANMKNNSNTMNTNNTNKKNNSNMMNINNGNKKNKTMKMNTNNGNKNNKKNIPTTTAPPPLENLMYEGRLYQTNRASGDTYENGKYVGKYIRPNSGRPYLEKSMGQSSLEAPNYENTNEGSSEEYDTESMNNSKAGKTLSMDGGGMSACGSCPFPGTGVCDFYARGGKQRGGGCGCSGGLLKGGRQRGGGCGCSAGLFKGGYRPTKKNLKALKKWRQGKSIGFTMTASLKAKGLIPRSSRKLKGKRVVSRKYR